MEHSTYATRTTCDRWQKDIDKPINDLEVLPLVPSGILRLEILGPNNCIDARDFAHRSATAGVLVGPVSDINSKSLKKELT